MSTWVEAWQEKRPRWWFDRYLDPLMGMALEHLDPLRAQGARLLHLGSSNGDKTEALRSLGFDVIGIDIEPALVDQAKKNHPNTTFLVADALHLPFEDEAFSGVFCFSVLQCVDWRRAIREARRVLAPGGRAVFIENMRGNPAARAYRILHRWAGWRYPRFQVPQEHIAWEELGEFERVFSSVSLDALHLTTPSLLAWPALKSHLFQVPIALEHESAFESLKRLDGSLLSRVPSLRRYAWKGVVCAVA